MRIRQIISGATNAAGDYDDVYLPKKASILGSPATDPLVDKVLGAVFLMASGALVFRLWRAKGPGRRKLQREREAD